MAPPVRAAYEAGPTALGLARACAAAGIDCQMAAPSLIARSSAGRRKRDATDAQLLARALRAGELTPVRVPEPIDEAARDLVRAREDARADLRARHRLSKLLLRHGLVYEHGRAWTQAHDAWLRRQRLGQPGARAAFEGYDGASAAASRSPTRCTNAATAGASSAWASGAADLLLSAHAWAGKRSRDSQRLRFGGPEEG